MTALSVSPVSLPCVPSVPVLAIPRDTAIPRYRDDRDKAGDNVMVVVRALAMT